ncbi:Microtubule-associated protein RP/EB family member 1 like [Actinidia chinensis var. chinensis]|uniref:Microtubule-associated protein RP/EB family member 1 like n=1 Tax=Actinidia chinensis var. chinensis TaxID=1590841 RepID=A0A2R6QAV4_ACTCC|nr:Microtubule-associated protein RP/EB family member 1 like [Actinidia chinensis var. chinensis]
MGTIPLLHFPSSATGPSPLLALPLYQNPSSRTSRFSKITRCRSAGYGGGDGSGRPRWDSNAEKTVGAERFRFNLDDEDGGYGLGFGSGAKKRVWWSDDSMGVDDDEDNGFGVLEDSIDASWIFKILNAFGWMVPAIAISLLLGTGPNAFFMALVLPLAQSAVAFATDTFWGRSSGGPRPKRKTKKKPFVRTESDIGMREEREDTESGKVRENYQSWSASNDVSTKTRDKRPQSFGGWDELDKRMGSYNAPQRALNQKANEPRPQKKGKLSRRVRSRDTPLLMRLLIAVFPFLGSWTKLF